MPNIIAALHIEIARVEEMIPTLSETAAEHARAVVREARTAMSLNQYEAMREALDDLQAWKVPKK